MKTKLMVRILITGLALLAGFQFWLLTGSVLVGALVGAVAWIFLVWFIKGLDRRQQFPVKNLLAFGILRSMSLPEGVTPVYTVSRTR